MTELETLLRTQWVKRDGSPDESMVKYCMTSSNYVNVNGYYINVGDKPGIDSQMWYDDETTAPDASKFETFKAYNLRGKRLDFEEATENRQIWVYVNYTNDRTGGKLMGWTTSRHGEEPHHLGDYHAANTDDIAAIKQGLAAQKANYEKRLATYWKRYSNKVHASGYWANR